MIILCPMCLLKFEVKDDFKGFVTDPRGVKRATCHKCRTNPIHKSEFTTDEALCYRQRMKKQGAS